MCPCHRPAQTYAPHITLKPTTTRLGEHQGSGDSFSSRIIAGPFKTLHTSQMSHMPFHTGGNYVADTHFWSRWRHVLWPPCSFSCHIRGPQAATVQVATRFAEVKLNSTLYGGLLEAPSAHLGILFQRVWRAAGNAVSNVRAISTFSSPTLNP